MYKTTVCFLFVLAIPCFCHAGGDSQEHWVITRFNFRLSEMWDMQIKNDFRYRGGNYSEQQNQAYFLYKGLEGPLNLGFGFRQVHVEDSEHEWRRENRPFFDLSIKGDIYDLKWSDRNRIEFREFENKKDVFRYCNRFKLSSPNKLFDLPLYPYIADEISIQEEKGYNRNRIYTGLVWDMSKKVDIDLFFIHQKDQTNEGWDSLYIAGFEVIFSF